jgi:hypothetical protein
MLVTARVFHRTQVWLQAGSPTSKLGATYSNPAWRKAVSRPQCEPIRVFVIHQLGRDFFEHRAAVENHQSKRKMHLQHCHCGERQPSPHNVTGFKADPPSS